MLIFFPLFCLFYTAIIKAEEAFPGKKFIGSYEEYRQNTNAIFPDTPKIKAAFSGHQFDFRKVIRNEYNSLFLYFAGILSFLLYKSIISLNVFSLITAIAVLLCLLL
ncbi:MAG TPA: hypothetical protein VHO46_00565 [Bacteroidales bacterium]|nr:hypothetical protein [Bacteroidales bacterium]